MQDQGGHDLVRSPLSVLIVEDNPHDADLMLMHLPEIDVSAGWQRVETEADYLAALESRPDLILCDWILPGFSGKRALQLLSERGLDIPFIVVSGSIGEETAIDALRLGADDYVLKDRPARLGTSVRRVLENKQAEAERAALEVQLQQAQKMESVGRLAGGVAHDFNNMLGVILGHVELALGEVGPDQPLHENLMEIKHAAERSADLTRQLLAFARRQIVVPRVIDLNETLSSMLKMLERLIGEDIELSFCPAADLWPLMIDPSQIDQILANLCVNARDAIGSVGRVTIQTKNSTIHATDPACGEGLLPGDYLCLIVADDGGGMDQETIAHVFEPFFTTKSLGEGTGLGLATVYGIVRQNQGFIGVKSEPDGGAVFTIYLPRHADASGDTGADTTRHLHHPARGEETILVVEDEPAILKITERMLAQQGYTVLAAGTPGEAMRMAQEHQGEIQLLITDVVMPEMNGRDLAKNLLSLYPHLKRLFMSGYTADVIAHHGVLGEGVFFLQKPFSVQGLATKVREALDGD